MSKKQRKQKKKERQQRQEQSASEARVMRVQLLSAQIQAQAWRFDPAEFVSALLIVAASTSHASGATGEQFQASAARAREAVVAADVGKQAEDG